MRYVSRRPASEANLASGRRNEHLIPIFVAVGSRSPPVSTQGNTSSIAYLGNSQTVTRGTLDYSLTIFVSQTPELPEIPVSVLTGSMSEPMLSC